MQGGGHELVVLGTCMPYCKIFLSSLYAKPCGIANCAWVGTLGQDESGSGASWNSSDSFIVEAALSSRSRPVASSLKKSSSVRGLSLRSFVNCQRVIDFK